MTKLGIMKKNPLISIFCVVFIDLVGFGIIIPILPYYAQSFDASATTLGWLMMCYSAMQFLFAPVWGRISDRVGRRPVLLTTIAGIGISMFILSQATSLFWLFAGRLLAGFFGANISVASAYIADITTPENRTKGMGIIGASFGLGFLFGPALGGFLSHWGYGAAAGAAAFLSLINFIFALAQLKEPVLTEEVRFEHRSHFDKKLLRQTLLEPKTGLPIFLFFLVTLGIAQLETSFALFLLARFGLDAMHAGFILAGMAVIMIAIQGGAIGKLVRRFGEISLILAGALLMACSLSAASFAPSILFFVVALLIHAFGYSMVTPSLSGLVSRHAGNHHQGATMGVYQSAGSLARIAGPITAGLLYDHAGIASPFRVAAVLFICSSVIAMRRLKSSPRKASADRQWNNQTVANRL